MIRRQKFNARKTPCNQCEKPHDSKAEAKRCDELHLLQKGGVIKCLTVQPQYWFQINGEVIKHSNGRRVGYKPDWHYFEGDLSIAEDSKGFRTPDYVLRVAIFKALHPYITFRETGK